jgi:hypothetical protein
VAGNLRGFVLDRNGAPFAGCATRPDLSNNMRDRKLTRAGVLEEYLVYQIRLVEALQCIQMASDIIDGKYKPKNSLGHGPDEFGRG